MEQQNDNANNLTKKERRELKRKEKEEIILNKEKGKKSKMILTFSIIFLVLALGVGSIVYLVINKSAFEGAVQPALLALSDSDWINGKKEAPATLIEYSDYQCPACAYFDPVLKKLENDLNGKVKIVYRHFPLPQHKNAKLAAYAAEAAGKQEKFFEMTGRIFEAQKRWEGLSENGAREIFKNFARELNLDMQKFETDLNNEEIKKSVDEDYKNGVALGINSTPTFYLNGKKLQNLTSYDAFKKAVEEEITTKD